VFGVENEINGPEGKKVFTALANTLISKKFPDFHNQAIMEFGALNCVPKNPDCPACTFQPHCFAAQHNLQSLLPRKAKSKPARKRYFYYIVIQKGGSLLMQKRDQKDIWHGLFDFPLLEERKPVKTEKLLVKIGEMMAVDSGRKKVEISGNYKHILTHQIILAKFILIKNGNFNLRREKNLKFYTFEKINDLPKPVLISRFLSDYKNFYS
jgi:A/G-specific adenine glycosylase